MDILKDRYPRKVECRKKLEVEIRPLEEKDIVQEIELYKQLDRRDQAKLPNDLDDPNYPSKMRRYLEDGRAYPLAAWHEDTLVAELILFRGMNSWVRHTGDVVLVTHPKYRRYGLAMVLFDEMIPVAEALGLEKLYANLMAQHKEATKLLTSIGFHQESCLKDHIKDSYGRYHDLCIYAMDLEAAHRAMEDLMSHFHDYSG
jgi:L-amino acid N-acyltransferase YncA